MVLMPVGSVKLGGVVKVIGMTGNSLTCSGVMVRKLCFKSSFKIMAPSAR